MVDLPDFVLFLALIRVRFEVYNEPFVAYFVLRASGALL